VLAVAPILPSRDLGATSAFYSRLGFSEMGLWPGEYLIVMRGEVGLHFFHAPGTDPFTSSAGCYVYVEDADALFVEFERLALRSAGIPRLQGPPQDADYGLREFAMVDPEGNLLRIGSSIAESASGQPG
jgi:catechol 2,3-dioxygenase-like lactoylglutathione lyase family enzyme